MPDRAGWEWALGFMPYGSRWRETRRVFHQHFSQAAVKKDHYGIVAREIRAFLQRVAQAIRDDPDACLDQGEVSGLVRKCLACFPLTHIEGPLEPLRGAFWTSCMAFKLKTTRISL